jgi:hypothetical protein
VQQPQPLGHHFTDEKIEASRVATRPGEARDQTVPDRVFADAEDDRDRRGRSFGREGSRGAGGRGDNGHATPDEVSYERWQAIVLALQPVVLDRHILTIDVAGFVETLTERSGTARIGRPAVDEADYRHRRLLRARRERPCRHRAADQRDELAPSS